MWVQCEYGQDFHEMHARLRSSKSLLTLYLIINKTYFPSLADEIAEPQPDMNIKVAAFTVSEKSSNTCNISFSRVHLPEICRCLQWQYIVSLKETIQRNQSYHLSYIISFHVSSNYKWAVLWKVIVAEEINRGHLSRLGMSVTTQGGSGRQYVTGSRRNISKYSFVLLNVYRFREH